MKSIDQFEAVCQAMFEPGFYPHPVFNLERQDTHISSVFLTGTWVYKLKKPLNLGFLDFRSLEDRNRFCQREVCLNQRLSQGIYIEVIHIYQKDNGRFTLQKTGRMVECAVKMKQLPEVVSLRELLKKNKIRPFHMDKLGQKMAAFYENADRRLEIDYYGHPNQIAYNMEENFTQLKPYVGSILNPEKWEFICQVCRAFFKDHLKLLDYRVETGRIRDGHGDLRTDHIYFYRGIQIIDCIEFNDRFRFGDVVADLAFLHMDLEHMACSTWSRAFLFAYADAAGDPEIYTLLDFYAAYRAVVRLKICCIRYREVDKIEQDSLKREIDHYTNQAYQYSIQFSRPTLWIFCGLPATGKSSLAQQAAKALSANVFQSDVVRKKIFPFACQGAVSFGKGGYRPALRHRVYGHLFALSQETLKNGQPAIIDATFSHKKWRDEARQMAVDVDTNIIFVESICRTETIHRRLRQRETESGLSDARLHHFPKMLEDFEAMDELDPDIHFTVDTDQPLARAIVQVLANGYTCKCRQVKKII